MTLTTCNTFDIFIFLLINLANVLLRIIDEVILARFGTEVIRNAIRMLYGVLDFIGRKFHATDDIKESLRFFHLMQSELS